MRARATPRRPPLAAELGSAKRAAGQQFATQITTAAFTAGVTLFLVRSLGPEGYGVFALAAGIGALVLLVTEFGIAESVGRFLAEKGGDVESRLVVFVHGLRLRLLTAGGLALLVAALSGQIADAYGIPELATPLRFVAAAMFGQSIFIMLSTCFVSIGRVATNFRAVLSESVIEAGAIVLLVLAGAGAAGAAAGRAVGYLLGAVLAVGLLLRGVGLGSVRRALGAPRPPGLLRYALALFVVDTSFVLFSYVDILLIGALLGSAAVGLFEAPFRLIRFLEYPGLALAAGLGPRLARSGRGGREVAAFGQGLRYLVMLQFLALAPLVVWAEPFVALALGDGYDDSVPVVRWAAVYAVLSGIGALISVAVTYVGYARARIPVALAALALNCAIDVALLPEIGIVAGAIGTGAAYVLYVAGHLRICHYAFQLQLRPLGRTTLRSLAAAGAMALVLAAFGTSELPVALLPVGLCAGCATYVAMLFVLRELTLQDVRALGVVGERAARTP